jgi:threonyl-tRNA synthetase
LEADIKKIVKAKHRYERLLLSKEEALDLFSYNRFKTHLIENKIPDGSMTSIYKIGDFIDLCTGPHLSHTGQAKGFAITKHSASYWLGDAKKDHLQRVYGVSFPDKA